MLFRKIITRFCQLPGVIAPILLLSIVAWTMPGGALLSASLFAWVLIVTLCVCFLCGALIKFIYYKERPAPQQYNTRRRKIDASSFPSIHTAYATIFMCAGLFLAEILYLQHTEWSTLWAIEISVLSIVFYVLIARSRMVLKKHFFIDTVFGTLLGFIAVIFVMTHIEAVLAVFDLMMSRV